MKGTVIKRGARWSVVIEVGRDPISGRRVRKWHSGFTSRKEAEAARVDILSRIQRGDYVSPGRQSLGEFMIREWLPAVKASVRPSTFDSYRRNTDLHIVPKIGAIRVQSLSASHLNGLYAELLERGRTDGSGGLSPRSVRYIHAVIHRALNDAVRWNVVTKNVASSAEPPRQSSGPHQFATWSRDQLRLFLEAVQEDRLAAAWYVAATTGMRRGEVLGVRWQDVDLDRKRLAVRQTLISVGYQIRTSSPKTKKGVRSIALDTETAKQIRKHRVAQLEEKLVAGGSYADRDLVFADSVGQPIHPDSFGKAFKRIQKANGLTPIRFHDLRHTHATLALEAGIHPRIVSERLGHSTIAMTLDTYSHVLPDMQEEAADKMAMLLFDRS